jgi:hypothetical protein
MDTPTPDELRGRQLRRLAFEALELEQQLRREDMNHAPGSIQRYQTTIRRHDRLSKHVSVAAEPA